MQPDRSYVSDNAGTRERLRILVDQSTAKDLRRMLPNGWTIAATLARLAFWDRFVLVRWEAAERAGEDTPVSIDDAMQDLINTAAAAQWHALAPSAAAREAIEAATAIDAKVESLGAGAVAATLATGRVALVARSIHRASHLDEIERAFGRFPA